MAMQSDHEFAPNQIAAVEFPTAFRGYDQDAVRTYLNRLSSALEERGEDALAALTRTTTLDRIEELEEENDSLRAELRDLELELVQRSVDGESGSGRTGRDDRASDRSGDRHISGAPNRDDDEFDEHRAIELLGRETARVLESARSAASDIVKRAEGEAAQRAKEADDELTEARKRARRIVADKQKEAEELVERVSGEAEATAARTRDEAEQHRLMVVEESNRILSEAETAAEGKETRALQRAEQIVGDAEALRQQILSELVVERTRTRTDLEEMTSVRDRLVMALVVARSEIESLSGRLDEITVTEEGTGDGVPDEVPQDEIDELVAELDDKLPSDPDARSGRSKKTGSAQKGQADADADAGTEGQTVIDLSDGSNGKPNGGGSGGVGSRSKRSRSKRRRNRSNRTSSSNGGPASGTAVAERSGSNTDVSQAKAETDSPTMNDGEADSAVDNTAQADDAPATVDDQTVDDQTVGDQTVDDETVDDQTVDDQTEADGQEVADDKTNEGSGGLIDDESALEPADPNDETDDQKGSGSDLEDSSAARIASGLIEGFNTIELTEADLRLAGVDSAGVTSRDEADVDVARGSSGQRLDQVITTVASRSETSAPDSNRGDLLIDSNYRGRLAAHFTARDVAMRRSDEFHRSMRRALNDDQSDVLDRLRAGRGSIDVGELPTFAEQLDRYLAPLQAGLEPVGLAGARSGGAKRSSRATLDNLERQLANFIVDRVRLPVIQLLEHNTNDDRERILEPIRTIYREFRNSSLVDVTEDAMYEAFAIGLYETIADGTNVVWDLDPRHDPDPVCEINASRGDVVKGTAFPSGHARPLALPNCRCLVVPRP